jgi:hypothetical protein
MRGILVALALVSAGCADEDARGIESLSGASLGSTAVPSTDTSTDPSGSESDETSESDVPAPGEPTAFRLDSITLVDPHVYAVLVSMDPMPPCIDGTVFLNDDLLAGAIADGSIDIVVLFPSYDEDAEEIEASLRPAECEPAGAPTMCSDSMATTLDTTAQNMASGDCFRPDASTLGAGYALPNAPSSPCFTSMPGELTLPLPGLAGGTSVVLQDVQFSATYADSGLVEGVLAGFATQAEAEVTVLDDGMVVMGGATLWEVIAGGDACETTIDDTDVHPDHGTGAWIYFDFTATPIGWTG